MTSSLALLLVLGCSGEKPVDDSGTNTTGITDGDADTDTDADSDADSDTDTDTDADSDTDTDTDTVPDPDTDPDVEDAREGNIYDVDLASGNVTEPAGLGSLLGSYIDFTLRAEVTDIRKNTIIFTMTDSGGNLPPTPIGGDFRSDPAYACGPADLAITVGTASAPLYDTTFAGSFSGDARMLNGVVLSGLLDTSGLGSLLGSTDPAAVCDFAGNFGASCEPCPDGTEYCLRLTDEDMTGVLL